MKKNFSCNRFFSKAEAEQVKLSVWELMDHHESIARDEILKAVGHSSFDVKPEDLRFDWHRQKTPECFMLRAWCVADKRNQEVTPNLIKAARELVGWTIADLATNAGLGYSTVADFERESRGQTWASTKIKMAVALEGGGVEFIPSGVRLRD